MGSAQSVFDRQVLRALNILSVCLITLALVPSGLVLLGTNWALGSLGWAANIVTNQATLLTPMFAFYLCLAFTTTLRHDCSSRADPLIAATS